MDEASHIPNPVFDSADEYCPEPEPEPEPLPWCDGSVRIGIHTSIAGDLVTALESAQKLGCNALQIFSASPRMWPRPGARITDADAARFRLRRSELGLGPLVVHANYLINLASPERVMRARSIQAFHDEIVRARTLGADFLVIHPGSARGQAREQAVRDVAEGLRQAARGIRFGVESFGELHRGGLRVLLENTSGMGSAVGSRFEELREVLDLAPDLPLGVCLDTAHAFEAGYQIHTQAGLDQLVGVIDRTVGLQRVAVVHVNDSRTPFGSRVDRHEHIGKGQIGLEAFRRILNHARMSAGVAEGLPGRAFILETPLDAPGDDRRNVRTLWTLVGIAAKQAPHAEDGFSMLRARRVPRDKADAGDQQGGAGNRRAANVKKSKSRRKAAKPISRRKG